MRTKLLCSALLMLATSTLCLSSRAAVGVTDIVQVRTPLMLHSDGTPYRETDLQMFTETRYSTIWMNDAVDYSYPPTTRASMCDGPDCPMHPLGFLPGATLPQGVELRAAELERRNLRNLMQADAYQFVRSDVHLTDNGGGQRGTYSRSLLDLAFQPDRADSITISLDAWRYTHAFLDQGTPDGGYAEARSGLSIALYDYNLSATVLLLKPEEFNTTVRVDEGAPGWHYDSGWQRFTVTSTVLDPSHLYSLAFLQETYATYNPDLPSPPPVPEPSGIWTLLGGMACLLLVRRKTGTPRRWLAPLALLLSGSAWAGGSASAGLQLSQPRLLHADGSRYVVADFADGLNDTHYGGFTVQANGSANSSGVNGTAAWQELSGCTGTACDVAPFPAAVTGDTAHGTLQWWRMHDFVTADAFQHIAVAASAVTQPSRVELDTKSEVFAFRVASPGPMTLAFDARAYGAVSADPDDSAFADLGFRVSLTENRTGSLLTFTPEALNLRLHAADGAYDTGMLSYTFDVPMLYGDRQYFLVIEQSLVTQVQAVPEPAPLAMYTIGALGMLGWAARRRTVSG